MGIVMFEALTGNPPFSAPSVAKLLLNIVREDAPRVSDFVKVDARLDGIVAKLLTRNKDERMPSARALSRELLPYAGMRARAELEVLSLIDSLGSVPNAATNTRCTTALALCEYVA
jgi:serine/threonine protein kinase